MTDPEEPLNNPYSDSLKSHTDQPDLDSAEKRFGTDGLFAALQNAKPAAIKESKPLFPTPPAGRTQNEPVRTDFPRGSVTHLQRQAAFPPDPAVAEIAAAAGSALPDISFIITDATVVEGDPPVESNKVFVQDGKVTSGGVSTFPDGMGFGGITLDLADPSDSLIYILVTFNPQTLVKTSVTTGVSNSADLPESRVESDTEGFLVFLLGFTFFDGDGDFRVFNRRLGDISFEFVYSSQNGQPALIPVFTDPGYLDLAFLP